MQYLLLFINNLFHYFFNSNIILCFIINIGLFNTYVRVIMLYFNNSFIYLFNIYFHQIVEV